MTISRRETAIGLGTLLVGGGVIGGVGAFDTVGADRDVTIEFADDSGAILGMGPAVGDRSSVTVAEGADGTVAIRIDRINRNARTAIDDIVAFTNNGSRTITEIGVALEDESENAILEIHDALEGVTIDPGETVIGLGATVDTRRSKGFTDASRIDATIRISTLTDPGGS